MELMGNEAAVSRLKRILQSGRVGHGYLFTGAPGTGKRTLSRWFAKAILCTGEAVPCGGCSACRKMERLSHPDYREYEGGERARSFPVETVREIRADCAVLPNEGKRKIYTLVGVQNMTSEGLNAFLKTLEEPPAHAVFFLLCPSAVLLPQTVRSRLVEIPLCPLRPSQVEQALAKALPQTDPALRRQAAYLSDGSVGLAKRLLEDESFAQRARQAQSLAQALTRGDEYQIACECVAFERDGAAFLQALRQTRLLLRYQLEQPAPAVPQKLLLALLDLLGEAELRLNQNAHKGLTGAWLAVEASRAARAFLR